MGPALALVLLGTSAPAGALPHIAAKLSPSHHSGLGSNAPPQSSLPCSPNSNCPTPVLPATSPHFFCLDTCQHLESIIGCVGPCATAVFPITRSCLSLYWSQNNRLTLSRSSMKFCWLNTKKECASYLPSVALDPIYACLRAWPTVVGENLGRAWVRTCAPASGPFKQLPCV